MAEFFNISLFITKPIETNKLVLIHGLSGIGHVHNSEIDSTLRNAPFLLSPSTGFATAKGYYRLL